MQRRERDEAVRRNALPAGGSEGVSSMSSSRGGNATGVSEEELFAPLRAAALGLPPTDAPVKIPSAGGGKAGDRPSNGRRNGHSGASGEVVGKRVGPAVGGRSASGGVNGRGSAGGRGRGRGQGGGGATGRGRSRR